jgi:hypothetical protein
MDRAKTNENYNSGTMPSGPQLELIVLPSIVPYFSKLLSEGFYVTTSANQNINAFLSREFGVQETYIDNRIQTVFLNGKAVDDTKAAIIEPGASLALSAAMPGMVGSTFRKGGVFAGMRNQISHVGESQASQDYLISVRLKLFNLIARELGQRFLQRGIWLAANRLQRFLSEKDDHLMHGCKSAKLEAQELKANELSQITFSTNWIKLRLEID